MGVILKNVSLCCDIEGFEVDVVLKKVRLSVCY